MEIIVSASQPHPRTFITCISGKALCRPGEAERHKMCSQNTQTPQFLATVSQTPGGSRCSLFPQLPKGRRRFSARVFLQHSREQIPVQQELTYVHSSLEGLSAFLQNQTAAPIHHPSLPALTQHSLCPSTKSLPGFSHHSQARLFQQGLLQLLGFVFLLDQFFWVFFKCPPPCNQQ